MLLYLHMLECLYMFVDYVYVHLYIYIFICIHYLGMFYMLFAPLINIMFATYQILLESATLMQKTAGNRCQISSKCLPKCLHSSIFTRISTLSMLTLSMLHNATHRWDELHEPWNEMSLVYWWCKGLSFQMLRTWRYCDVTEQTSVGLG